MTVVAETFRQEADQDLAKLIQELKVGEAVVSVLAADGTPTYADRVMIYPPKSLLGTADPSLVNALINRSSLMDKYGEAINRESAHEQIAVWAQEKEAALQESLEKEEAEKAQKKAEQSEKAEEKAAKKTSSPRKTDSAMDRFTKNVMSAVGREAGRILMRGITGMLTGKK